MYDAAHTYSGISLTLLMFGKRHRSFQFQHYLELFFSVRADAGKAGGYPINAPFFQDEHVSPAAAL